MYDGFSNYETRAAYDSIYTDQSDRNYYDHQYCQLLNLYEKDYSLERLADLMRYQITKDNAGDNNTLTGFQSELITKSLSRIDFEELARKYTGGVYPKINCGFGTPQTFLAYCWAKNPRNRKKYESLTVCKLTGNNPEKTADVLEKTIRRDFMGEIPEIKDQDFFQILQIGISEVNFTEVARAFIFDMLEHYGEEDEKPAAEGEDKADGK